MFATQETFILILEGPYTLVLIDDAQLVDFRVYGFVESQLLIRTDRNRQGLSMEVKLWRIDYHYKIQNAPVFC
jgi:hypothetical protein